MKVANIKSSPSISSSHDRSLGIQLYDEDNDYPNKILEIVNASVTGKSCLKIYKDFIFGGGFSAEEVGNMVVNRDGELLSQILRAVSNDFGDYGGCAIHLNYNANFKVVEIFHVPLEHVRFNAINEDTGTFDAVSIHPDWARKLTGIKKWKKDDIERVHLFNPHPKAIEEQLVDIKADENNELTEAEKWANFKGQVFYFSRNGDKVYPTPIYEPALTNMRTEEAVANVVGRNATNNFLPSIAIVEVNTPSDKSQEQFDKTNESLKRFQGDDVSGQIMHIQVESREQIPEVIRLSGENYDKEFSVTQKYVPDSIGRAFNQPPILRGEDVGGNIGAELLTNAYNFYNSITSNERVDLEMIFEEIFKYWHSPVEGDFSINPLKFEFALNLANIPMELLQDLTVDERRELLGYNPKGEITTNNNQKTGGKLYDYFRGRRKGAR